MANYGALGKLAMSLGRELFGSAARGTNGIVELAEKSGVKMDALQDSSPEELMSVMDRAARQRLIDPRFANSINIQIAKDAQEAMPTKPTATELRRQANIDRFGYDPNDAPDAPARTPTDDAGFESYLEQVNPNFKRIAAEDRPNLMMGDMYGMLPRNSEVIRSENGVTFHRAPNGDHYATAFNPDVNEEDVVGYITNRGDGTELAVTQEMQGQGIGGELQYMFRKENPNAATGGLTEAGEKSLQRTYNRLSEEGIAKDAQAAVPELNLKDRIVEKYPNVKLDLFGDASKGYELSRIELPKEVRGQGIGTDIMDDLISGADAEGATISLTPDTSFGGSSVSRLNNFYKQFGFVDNKGKNKNFSTRNTMYRVPLKDTE